MPPIICREIIRFRACKALATAPLGGVTGAHANPPGGTTILVAPSSRAVLDWRVAGHASVGRDELAQHADLAALRLPPPASTKAVRADASPGISSSSPGARRDFPPAREAAPARQVAVFAESEARTRIC